MAPVSRLIIAVNARNVLESLRKRRDSPRQSASEALAAAMAHLDIVTYNYEGERLRSCILLMILLRGGRLNVTNV